MTPSPNRATVLRIGAPALLVATVLLAAFLVIHPEDGGQRLLHGATRDAPSVSGKRITCPDKPGFTGTRATQTRYENCEEALSIQSMLLSEGALAANVTVTGVETGKLTGPPVEKNVYVQVFWPRSRTNEFRARPTAEAIAAKVGTSIERVHIVDDQLNTLFGHAQDTRARHSGPAPTDRPAAP